MEWCESLSAAPAALGGGPQHFDLNKRAAQDVWYASNRRFGSTFFVRPEEPGVKTA